MIKHINTHEIAKLQKKLLSIVRIKNAISHKRTNMNKSKLKNLIVARQIMSEDQVNSFLDKGNKLTIKRLAKRKKREYKNKLIELSKIKKVMLNSELEKFYNKELPLDKATKVYQILKSGYYDIKNINSIMLNYFYKDKIINYDGFNEFNEYFLKPDAPNRYNRINAPYKAVDSIMNIIETICKMKKIDLKVHQFSSILTEEDVEEEFRSIQKGLLFDITNYLDTVTGYSEEEIEDYKLDLEDHLVEHFESIFDDDCRVFCFKNCILNNDTIEIINKWGEGNDGQGFQCMVYNENNNLYLTISYNSIFDGIDFEFILLFLCSLLELN